MAVLPIRVVPDPILRKKSKRVRNIDGSIHKLISNMIETMHTASGVGLAAPQVGVSLRVIVLGIPEQPDFTIINPVIVRKKGERVINEGCLSLPGYVGQVKRAMSVTVKGHNPEGTEVRVKGEELLAQALEHEIDHLNGILYIDQLVGMTEPQKIEPVEKPTSIQPAQTPTVQA